MKKRILIVSRAFYPVIAPRAFRATELAKEFSKKGHHVDILTHKLDYDYSTFENNYNVKVHDFVGKKWVNFGSDSRFLKLLKSALNYLILFPDIQLTYHLKKELLNDSFINYDLLISLAVPYPVHWGVALALTQRKNITKKWIADCGDPFMGNMESKVRPPFYFRYIEKWFCEQPDYISIPIKEAVNAYPYVCKQKIVVIPQGFDFSDSNITEYKKSDITTFAYAGTLSRGIRDPKPFLEYLKTKTNTKFKFIVYTNNTELLNDYTSTMSEHIVVKGYIPREELLNELSQMDFLVNFENKHDVQRPSKLIDYAIVKRPILNIKHNDIDVENIEAFLRGDYKKQYVIPNIENYDISNVANNFLTLI